MLERIVPGNTIIAAFRTRLLAVPAVSAVHLVAAATKGEAAVGLVAYVVGGQRKALDAAIADSGYPGPVALVRVHALPLRPDGGVDDNALAALPAWSQASLPPTAVYRPIAPLRTRIHLADLLPDYPLLTSTVQETLLSRAPANGAADKPAVSRLRSLPAQPQQPQLPANLAEALVRAAQHPELGIVHVAADMSEIRVSYTELFDQACRILGGLRARGVRSGDVVLVDSADSRSLLPLFWACILGAIVPAPFKVAAAAAGGASLKRLRDSWEVLGRPFIAADPASLQALASLDADALSGMSLLDTSELCRAESAIPSPASDLHALSMLFMTSGSTGLPKGVMLSQANVLAMIAGTAERGAALTPGATTMNWMPLDHVGGLGFLSILPLVLGMNQIQVDTATVLEAPVRWLDLAHRHRVCMIWTPNFAFELLQQAASAPGAARDWDLSSLRMIVNGGEAVSDSVLTAFTARFAQNKLPAGAIWPSFGMTETVSAFCMSQWTPGNGEVVSLGLPICGAVHRIVDQHGEVVPEGIIGAVELSGDSLFMGYFGREDLTAEAMHGNWFRTGDMGIIRNDELFVVGRIKEMIIVNGANFYSSEIEEVVAQTKGVERISIAAVGVRAPAARTDQLALFFHVADVSPGHDDALRRVMQDIRMRLGKQLSLMPAYFIHVPADRLPRTNSGKVQRIELKRQLEAGVFDTEIKHAACLLEAAGTIPLWFSEPFWKVCPLAIPAGESVHGKSIAVLGDATAGDAAIRAALAQAAGDIEWRQFELEESVDPMSFLGHLFNQMAQQGLPDVILVLPGWARLPRLLSLCQALAATARGNRPARLIVCGGAEAAHAADHAAAAAFLRTAAAEIDGVHCVHIQFSGKDLGSDAGMILGDLRNHTRNDLRETELAYIDGVRHLRRWRNVELSKADRPALRSGGLYLISGGLGGVGLLLARHLLDRHEAKLLIVGRTGLAQLDAARATALQELERSGRVLYVSADVAALADAAALRAAVAQARARWSCGLDGILHLAGEGRQTELGRETAATLAQMMHAKVAGSLALQELAEAHPDAWLVLVGSVAGMVAGRQDSAYAAANAWQAAMAEQLAASGNGNTRCRYLGFSSWRHTGLSKNGAPVSTVEAAGYFSLEPEYAVASFDIALSVSRPVLAIGLDLQHARHAGLQDAAIAVDEALVLETETGGAAQGPVMLRDHFGRSLPVAVLTVDDIPRTESGGIDREQLTRIAGGFRQQGRPGSEFERYMAQLWKQILDLSACGVHDDFFALGGNSLRAAQIAAATRERFRLNTATPDLLQNPTVAGYCAHVRRGESKPGITEAIARRWLEIEQMTPEQKAARVAARTV
ncbi:SDR family NAD(P)-dependent oxidoreductase [Herbaspirillum rhizosphaerae]|uniref:SDR family NAD(P)-dependent oxidoreductase n=1 Tax=Herbaspirillum rhizosphaerae TaxID=346179 RepID=UPI00067D4AEB|nr:SDR family NAD(P)-dependent oxidoreductase [Herbaspirillum rhizosphaerae]